MNLSKLTITLATSTLLLGLNTLGLAESLKVVDRDAIEACDSAVRACDDLVLNLKSLVEQQDELVKKLYQQRDEAFEELSKQGTDIPWYYWLGLGILGGVALKGL